MQPTRPLRALLVLSGLIAVAIGASILFTPAAFHAGHGIELGSDANLLSEVRAPGGALLALGCMMLVGSFALASTSIDAAAVELGIGAACALALVRGARRAQSPSGSAAASGARSEARGVEVA